MSAAQTLVADRPAEAPHGDDIEAVLAQLDADLVALAPVKARIREIAALLVIGRASCRERVSDTV